MAPADRSSGHFPTGFHPSATGRIRVVASLLSTPADQFTPNDSLDYRFEVSDSTLARAMKDRLLQVSDSAMVVESDNPSELPVGAEISSITFSLEAPVAGDSFYAGALDIQRRTRQPDRPHAYLSLPRLMLRARRLPAVGIGLIPLE